MVVPGDDRDGPAEQQTTSQQQGTAVDAETMALLQALASRRESPGPITSLDPALVRVLQTVGRTGDALYGESVPKQRWSGGFLTLSPRVDWPLLRSLIIEAFKLAVHQYEESATSAPPALIDGVPPEQFCNRIISSIDQFESAPWTLQRMCELLSNPRQYWSTGDKFVYAFSKVVLGIRSNQQRFRLGSWGSNDEGELAYIRWPSEPDMATVNAVKPDIDLIGDPMDTVEPYSREMAYATVRPSAHRSGEATTGMGRPVEDAVRSHDDDAACDENGNNSPDPKVPE
ncbi:hypothetical protein PBRA_005865 [Plasmodiophora brassicae]|uniref:Uncharacterized protein n=1 Tax=Plasmodiophora brassicae TaxID=37360 RepID=A0A0G4IRN0_PLABS|nr:hypothetical protein PBRA_005865 [Plasmodiophora brassicae]